MFWKRTLMCMLGAGLLGTALAESPAQAGDCAVACPNPAGICGCTATSVDVQAGSTGTPLLRSDEDGAATMITGRRPNTWPSYRFSYTLVRLGSTYHSVSATTMCRNAAGQIAFGPSAVNIVSTNSEKNLDCPASHPFVQRATLAINFTNDDCPQGELGCTILE